MVLLGESVLQLVTSPMPIAGDSEYTEVELQSMFEAVQVLGFILTLTVMHSFIISNPTNPHEHVMGKPGSAKGEPRPKCNHYAPCLSGCDALTVGIGCRRAVAHPLPGKGCRRVVCRHRYQARPL